MVGILISIISNSENKWCLNAKFEKDLKFSEL